jgi:hypothetical protein
MEVPPRAKHREGGDVRKHQPTYLDRSWAEAFPDVPLIRWVDDVLLLCRNRQDAESSLRELTRLLDMAKMPPKSDPPSVISDLGINESAVCLGYELHERNGRLEASIPGRAWEGLRPSLRDAHRADHPAVHARQVILGWVDYLGPSLETTDVTVASDHITEIAASEGFEDIPDAEELRKRWEKAFERYQEGREHFDTVISAHHHDGEDRVSGPRPMTFGFARPAGGQTDVGRSVAGLRDSTTALPSPLGLTPRRLTCWHGSHQSVPAPLNRRPSTTNQYPRLS